MRDKYRALYEINIKKQGRDMVLTKKLRGLQTDLLNEKMILEKARMDEADELNKLQNVENERDEMQKVCLCRCTSYISPHLCANHVAGVAMSRM